MKKIVAFILSSTIFWSTVVQGQETSDYIEEVGTSGVINWTAQYVEASGTSIINTEKFKNPTQARLMAQRGAEVIAKANLLEAVSGVRVIRESTVKDLILESDEIKIHLEGTIKGSRIIGKPKTVEDAVTVIVRMPLYGNGSIADAVESAPSVEKYDPTSQNDNTKTKPTSQESQIETRVSADPVVTAATPKASEINNLGFAFDFGDLIFDPSLFPVMYAAHQVHLVHAQFAA